MRNASQKQSESGSLDKYAVREAGEIPAALIQIDLFTEDLQKGKLTPAQQAEALAAIRIMVQGIRGIFGAVL